MPYDGNNIKDLDVTKPAEGASYIPELNDSDREIKRVLKNQYKIVSKSANYTLTESDAIVNATVSGINLTLPSPSLVAGGGSSKFYIVKNSSAGDITIIGTIDGQSNLTLKASEMVIIVTDGSAWWRSNPLTPVAHATRHQSGGADAIKLDTLAEPDDNTNLNVNTVRHGLCPKAPGDESLFLRGDSTWATPVFSGSLGYALQFRALMFNPFNQSTYYVGNPDASRLETNKNRIHIPKAGTITRVIVYWCAAEDYGGSGETINVYLRKNNQTDYTIGSWSNTLPRKTMNNGGLSIPMEIADYFEIKIVTPNWSNPPIEVTISGVVFIE